MKKIMSIMLVAALLTGILVIPATAAVAPTAVEDAVLWAIATANDDTHGYSQANRWGNPDYDCASFVICAYRSVGFSLSNAVHCGNMKQPFIDEGFEWIPKSKIDLSNSKSLKRGDILLNTSRHTEIYIGNNKMVGAHEGTIDDYDIKDPGDSTGKEICPVTYSNNSNWEGILRYPSDKILDIGTDFYAYILNTATNKYLTNDNRNVSVRSFTGESNQVWKFERQTNGTYIIRTCFDSKVLNVSNRGTTAGTNVGVYKNTDSTAKRWYIYGKEGAYEFKPQLVDLSLYVENGSSSSADGTNVCLWTDNNSKAQRFSIVRVSTPQSTYVECTPGTSTEPTYIWWNYTLYTDTYDVKIYQGTIADGNLYTELTDVTDTNCQVTLPAGDYECYVVSRSSFSSTDSMNIVAFTVKEGVEFILGDVDEDGKLSVIDATKIQFYLALLSDMTQTQLQKADVDKDSKVSVIDANIIQMYLAGLRQEL